MVFENMNPRFRVLIGYILTAILALLGVSINYWMYGTVIVTSDDASAKAVTDLEANLGTLSMIVRGDFEAKTIDFSEPLSSMEKETDEKFHDDWNSLYSIMTVVNIMIGVGFLFMLIASLVPPPMYHVLGLVPVICFGGAPLYFYLQRPDLNTMLFNDEKAPYTLYESETVVNTKPIIFISYSVFLIAAAALAAIAGYLNGRQIWKKEKKENEAYV
ncbi:choline transporter-like (slc family 44) [Anaeramoeba flamelloides]|uniref:Choline transporter-like (Slc family 44) n=1 Tax=Anaeramoeba flamelloides TaxID=1746091 RepID=A0AAV7YMJ5_9EUKA|nr:choline transporter-like (slc family 44) [Anaeramoeba flamelloides]KAJ6239106.1 choline transporter-like (slc family 44) [Anaeramoeba flamelloides]